jgi:diaminohydroxyphosphoribosylaminopyrimidine deaminase/5-amino-6-(5-phosphoribosylamino)uracil reductase
VWRLPVAGGRVAPRALAARLAREGRHEVLLEGGAALGTAWMRAGLVDRLALFLAPRMLGGEGLGWLGPLGRSLATAPRGRLLSLSRAGGDAFALVEVA